MNSTSGELLEPFGTRTSVRRGSLFVISSLNNTNVDLLEGFQPRFSCDRVNDQDCDGSEKHLNDSWSCESGSILNIEKAESTPKVDPVATSEQTPMELLEPFAKLRNSNRALNYVWESLPNLQWSSSKSLAAPTLPNTAWSSTKTLSTTPSNMQSEMNHKKEKLKISQWDTVIASVQDSEDFRKLKKDMRSARVVTGGGANEAFAQLLHKAQILQQVEFNAKQDSSNKLRRRSRSSGFRESTLLGSSNLSPFAFSRDDD